MTINWTPNPDRPVSPLTRTGRCLRPSGEHTTPNGDSRCDICGAIATYDRPKAQEVDYCSICGEGIVKVLPDHPEIDPVCADCYLTMQSR